MCLDPDFLCGLEEKKEARSLRASRVLSDYAVFPARQPCYYLAAGM
jgi:hypothetical protein